VLSAVSFSAEMTLFAALLTDPLATFKTHVYATIAAHMLSTFMAFHKTIVADGMRFDFTDPDVFHLVSTRFTARI
jgi:hypothetical protein